MIDGVRVMLIHSTVAAVAVGNMIPFGRAGETDGAIVLCSGHQPFPRVGIARHVLDFRDGETLVERDPGTPTVRGPVDPAVVAGINDLGVSGYEGEAVLVRMDAVGSLGGNVRPTQKVSSQRVDRTDVNLVALVGCRHDVPVEKRLSNVERRRYRPDFGPGHAASAPEMRRPAA